MIPLVALLISSTPLDPLLAKLDDVTFLEADFAQTDFWALTREQETSTGHLLLASPDLFLFRYDGSGGRVIGFDGATLYTIEPASRQVLLSEGGGSSFLTFLDLGSDPGVLTESSVEGDIVEIVLEGDLGDGIARMEIAFAASDSLPLSLLSVDVNGNRTGWILSSVEVSGAAPEGCFDLEIPDGFEVVMPGGGGI
jgi:outer membrane lipoprotein-sorting protein